jgi:hypothetical protein
LTDSGTVFVYGFNSNVPASTLRLMDAYTAGVVTPPRPTLTLTATASISHTHYMHDVNNAKDGEIIFTTGHATYPATGISATSVVDPASPTALGSLTTPGIEIGGIARIGTGASRKVVVGTSEAAVGATPGVMYLRVIDASNPASMSIIGSVAFSSPIAGHVVNKVEGLSDTLVAVSFSIAGIRIVDISNPTSPVIVGSLASGGLLTGAGSDMAALTPNLLVYQQSNRLVAINTSNPAAPTAVGFIARQFEATSYNYTGIVRYSDTMAVVTQSAGGMATIDFTNPASPVRKSTVAPGGTMWNLDKGIVSGNI